MSTTIDRSQFTNIIEGKTFEDTLVLDGSKYDNTLIINCTFKNIDGDGITVRNADNVTIANNTISDVSGTGVRMAMAGSSDNVTVIDNDISNIGDNGISAGENHSNLRIIGNTIDNAGTNGDHKEGNSPTPDMHGMYIQAKDYYIADNYVTNSTDGNGISLRSTGVVENNLVEHSGKSGIAYYSDHPAGPSDTVQITDNTVTDSGTYAGSRNDIDLLSPPNTGNCAANFVISGNTITDTSSGVKAASSLASIANVDIGDNSVVSSGDFDAAAKAWLDAGHNNPLSGGSSSTDAASGDASVSDDSAATDDSTEVDETVATDDSTVVDETVATDDSAVVDDTASGVSDDTIVVTAVPAGDALPPFAEVLHLAGHGMAGDFHVMLAASQPLSDALLHFSNGDTLSIHMTHGADAGRGDMAAHHDGGLAGQAHAIDLTHSWA